MRDTKEITVQDIYDKAWRMGRIDPLGKPISLDHFLKVMHEEDVQLRAEPDGFLEGGQYDRGAVVRVVTRDRPLFFMVPTVAFPFLRDLLSEADYALLTARAEPSRLREARG